MAIKRYVVALTTDSSGDATGYTPVLDGVLAQIHYVKTDFADGVDFAITSEATGQSLWSEDNVNAAKIVAPKQPVYSQAGVAALYAAGGAAVLENIYLAKDRVKIVVAQGGATKSGTFHVVIA